jgi:Family of unknown function (DUF6364)
MTTLRKLTLSIDEKVIESARRYSQRHNVSISQLVTRYLARLGEPRQPRRVSGTVKRLRGILPSDATVDAHRRHLEQKYGR